MRAFYKIPKKIFNSIIPMGVLLVGVSSCTVSQGTVGVNDGIYFDPSTDSQVRESHRYEEYQEYQSNETYQEPVRIGGKYFDDYGNSPRETYTGTYAYSNYSNDQPVIGNGKQASDYIEWGDEGETKVDIINNYYGYGLYSPLYSPLAYSYYNPYTPYYGNYFSMWGGYNYGFSFGWNSFFGNPYYSGFYGMGYYPYSYYGYPYYRGYRGFYGHYSPYYGYTPYYGYSGGYYYPRQYRRVERGKGMKSNVNYKGDNRVRENRQVYYNKSSNSNSTIRNNRGSGDNINRRRSYDRNSIRDSRNNNSYRRVNPTNSYRSREMNSSRMTSPNSRGNTIRSVTPSRGSGRIIR